MALDDILVDVGDWSAAISELPTEALVTLPDILSEGGSVQGSQVNEVGVTPNVVVLVIED